MFGLGGGGGDWGGVWCMGYAGDGGQNFVCSEDVFQFQKSMQR